MEYIRIFYTKTGSGFLSQTIILYIVIITSLINLSLQNGDQNLWISFLSASIGYLLPNPSIKKQTVILHRNNNI